MLRDYILFDGFTIIILINIILVAITKTLNSLKFKHFLLIYLNNSFLKFNSNDNNYLSNFNVLLNINYIVSISVFICVIFSYNSYSPSNIFEISEFIKILFFLTVFLYCKYLVELIVGWAFSINKFIATINLQKNSFNQLMGVVVILLNTLAIYSFPNSLTFIKISLFIVISLYLIGIYKVITLNDNLILSNMFYFILYLCTLEIVPILFIINELI